MRLFGYEITRAAPVAEQRVSPEDPRISLSDPRIVDLIYGEGARSPAGVSVTEGKASTYSAVYACVRVIAETLASLPLQIHQDLGDGRRRYAPEHPLAALLAREPNPDNTSFYWRETKQAHALLWGNGYSRIEMTRGGEVRAIYPLEPWRMTPERYNGRLRFRYRLDDGEEILSASEVLHVPALGFDGLVGKSPVRQMRDTIGLGLATQDFGSRFFGNDARPGVIMEVPGRLKDEAQKKLVESLQRNYAGLENKWKVLVLEDGAKMHMVQMPLEDAQFLETRAFQKLEICAIYRVPPHMVASLEKGASYASIEQQDINFTKHCILPWCVRWEQELNRKLFRSGEYFVRFNLGGLMRGDFEARTNGYKNGILDGWLLRNEVRALEDMEPIEGLDTPMVPLNFTSADKLGAPSSTDRVKPAGNAEE